MVSATRLCGGLCIVCALGSMTYRRKLKQAWAIAHSMQLASFGVPSSVGNCLSEERANGCVLCRRYVPHFYVPQAPAGASKNPCPIGERHTVVETQIYVRGMHCNISVVISHFPGANSEASGFLSRPGHFNAPLVERHNCPSEHFANRAERWPGANQDILKGAGCARDGHSLPKSLPTTSDRSLFITTVDTPSPLSWAATARALNAADRFARNAHPPVQTTCMWLPGNQEFL